MLRSGRHTIGAKVREFEAAFAELVGVPHAVMVNSGSSANLLAVAAAHWHLGPFKAGDEAIVPALAWATTYAPLQQHGLKLRVVDIELDTLNVDVSQLRLALTSRTRVLVAVSVLGNPAALVAQRKFADEHGLVLIEDNCESLGATVEGRQCGTFGDLGTFSFFFSHHLNTVEGGMLVTANPVLADVARCLRAHGWTRDLPPDSPLRGNAAGFEAAYDFALPGYNVRPMELAAAAGLEQLDGLSDKALWRRANAGYFRGTIAGDSRFLLQRCEEGAVPFALTMICREPGKRAAVLEKLRAAGIEHRLIAGGCFTRHRAALCYDYEAVGELPNARWAHDHGFMLGNHGADLAAQIRVLPEVLA